MRLINLRWRSNNEKYNRLKGQPLGKKSFLFYLCIIALTLISVFSLQKLQMNYQSLSIRIQELVWYCYAFDFTSACFSWNKCLMILVVIFNIVHCIVLLLDDCIPGCGSMGCFIWGREHTSVCSCIHKCPCCRYYRDPQATESFQQFLQIYRFSFWMMKSPKVKDKLVQTTFLYMITTHSQPHKKQIQQMELSRVAVATVRLYLFMTQLPTQSAFRFIHFPPMFRDL